MFGNVKCSPYFCLILITTLNIKIMCFIELTNYNGKKFIGNVNLLQAVYCQDKGAYVVGWNNNGGFEVKESYEEIIEKINANLAKVNRLPKSK
jgi:uncharacterized protein YlzI (FlbEa/FlbD family)